MPNAISDALGTARQFTPKPDATYQGRYNDLRPSQVYAGQSSWSTLADNMARLNNALQSYAVSHEKYLESTGLEGAEALIKSKSPEEIEKLNTIDGAQIAGFVDMGSNPYFKAYAEKLRGNFLSAKIKQEYDDKYASIPAKSATEEAQRYAKFTNDRRDEILRNAPASNLLAFDKGYYENALVNNNNLVTTYNKKKNEEAIINTVSDITNELGQLTADAPLILAKDNHTFSERVQEIFNSTRLMGLPAQIREKLVKDWVKELVDTGVMPTERLNMMLDKIVIQTNMTGDTKVMSDIVDKKLLSEANLAQNMRYNQAQVEDWCKKYGDTKQAQKFIDETIAFQFTNPDEFRKRSVAIPAVLSRARQKENEDKALMRSYARSKLTGAGGSGAGGKTISDPDVISQAIGAWQSGMQFCGQYGSISNMKFEPAVFVDCMSNQIRYLASNGNYGLITKVMAMPQAKNIKSDLSTQFATSLAGVTLDSNGQVQYDQQTKDLINWINRDPSGVIATFGGTLATEAMTIAGLTRCTGSLDSAMQKYAVWNGYTSEQKADAKKPFSSVSFYDAEGVANLRGDSYDHKVDITNSPSRRSAWETLCAIYKMEGKGDEAAMNLAGSEIANNYVYYRHAEIPKGCYNELGTQADNYWFAVALDNECYLDDGTADNSIFINYDEVHETFMFESTVNHTIGGKATKKWYKPLSYFRLAAQEAARAEGKKQVETFVANDTSMTPEYANSHKETLESVLPTSPAFYNRVAEAGYEWAKNVKDKGLIDGTLSTLGFD